MHGAICLDRGTALGKLLAAGTEAASKLNGTEDRGSCRLQSILIGEAIFGEAVKMTALELAMVTDIAQGELVGYWTMDSRLVDRREMGGR